MKKTCGANKNKSRYTCSRFFHRRYFPFDCIRLIHSVYFETKLSLNVVVFLRTWGLCRRSCCLRQSRAKIGPASVNKSGAMASQGKHLIGEFADFHCDVRTALAEEMTQFACIHGYDNFCFAGFGRTKRASSLRVFGRIDAFFSDIPCFFNSFVNSS